MSVETGFEHGTTETGLVFRIYKLMLTLSYKGMTKQKQTKKIRLSAKPVYRTRHVCHRIFLVIRKFPHFCKKIKKQMCISILHSL